jgi:branched-subunit amino acid transport protein
MVCFIIIIYLNVAIPLIRPKNSAFPPWFSKLLKFYIKKKNQYFRKYKKI